MSFENNLVSVIMSVYNGEKNLEESINSILTQSHKNIEFLIIDDCSQDNTKKILQKYNKNYNNIKIFKNDKNLGLTLSLNKLLKISKGEYIARQDADDISLGNRIEKQLTALTRYKLDFCSSRARIKQNNRIIPGFSFYLPKKIILKYKNPFIHGTLLIKKHIIESIGYYDPRYYYAQDYKLMKDLIDKKYKFRVLKEPLYILNMEDNISTLKSSEQEQFAKLVRKEINQ